MPEKGVVAQTKLLADLTELFAKPLPILARHGLRPRRFLQAEAAGQDGPADAARGQEPLPTHGFASASSTVWYRPGTRVVDRLNDSGWPANGRSSNRLCVSRDRSELGGRLPNRMLSPAFTSRTCRPCSVSRVNRAPIPCRLDLWPRSRNPIHPPCLPSLRRSCSGPPELETAMSMSPSLS